jgi:4-hydroxybenzoate polyprenyltransferase
MWCITAFGYVSNDLADMVEDACNKPDRPLPSGRIESGHARWVAVALAAGGLAWAASVSWLGLLAAALALVLLQVYNHQLKGSAGAGNFLIGLMAGTALLAGGVSAIGPDLASLRPILLPALTLTGFITSREVLKTLEDLPGDLMAARYTLAVRLGPSTTTHIFAALALNTVAISLLPMPLLGYSAAYGAIIVLGVDLPLLAAAAYLATAPLPSHAARWLRVLKASYAAGLLALLLA